MKRIWGMSLMIATLVILDQLSKGIVEDNFYLGESVSIIEGFFSFTYIRNTGSAFGFLADASDSIRKPLFLYLPLIACFWIVVLIWQTRKESFKLCLSYSLILAGAVGNLMDRFSLGYVTDFLDFYLGKFHYPAFNVADSCITIAATLLIHDMIFAVRRNKAAGIAIKKL